MLRSGKQVRLSTIPSLKQSKQSLSEKQKKYRCDCCKDNKYHDYNRANRLRRQSASSKRPSLTSRQSTFNNLEENSINVLSTEVICSTDNNEVKARDFSSHKKLPSIVQISHLYEQHQKKDNNSNTKTPKVDMKNYCKNLFSSQKKGKVQNRIEVMLDGERYLIEFDSSEKMKLAIGELKLLIGNSQKNVGKQKVTK